MQRASIPFITRTAALAGLMLCASSVATAVPILFSGAGDDAAGIQAVVDQFRAELGDPNNANAAGPLAQGRREINWDGGGSLDAAEAPPIFDGFLNTRGAQFTTPGTGFVQSPDAGLATLLANPTYEDQFEAFSQARVFTPLGSNITDSLFFIPGTAGAIRASVSGFGAIFNDVDITDGTSIEFFDAGDGSLGSFSVPVGNFAFLGVRFTTEQIGRVRITTGNSALGPNEDAELDLVVMDDFLYAEPQLLQQEVPEPSTLALLALGACALLGRRLRRNDQTA